MISQTTMTAMCTLLRCSGQPVSALNQAEWAYNTFFVPVLTQNGVPPESHDAVVNAMLYAGGEAGFDVATQVAEMLQKAQAMAQQQAAPAPQSMPPVSGPPVQPAPQPPVNAPPSNQPLPGQLTLGVPGMPPNPISDATEPPVAQLPITEPPSKPSQADAVHAVHPDGSFTCGECGQLAKSVRGLKSHLTKSHQIGWKDYCGKNGLNDDGVPQGSAPAQPDPIAQIPSSQPPAGPDMSAGPAPQQGAMPSVPPPASVTTVAPPQSPAPTTAPPVGYQPPPSAAPAQAPAQAPAPASSGPTTVSNRADIARLLGGEVDLMVVPLLEASTAIDKLKGRTDANQLAQLALAQAMMEITDPDDIKFRRHRDVSLRIFGEMLAKHPSIFVFQQGYNYLLGDEYLPIISSRATKVTVIADKGKSIQSIDLE